MRPETENLIAEVERLSGLPVHVMPVRELGVVATVTLSPQATDSYVVQYRPGIRFLDYAIAVECAQVLRLLALPPAERFQFGSSPGAMQWGVGLVRKLFGKAQRPRLPDAALDGFATKLVGGLLTQLRSIPIVMRVDAWLAAEYPTLAELQAESFAVQQREALGSLSPAIRESVPEEIVAGSLLLNTAYALFCDRLVGGTAYQAPYVAAGFEDLGRALLTSFDTLPSEPANDRALVNRWAEEIGLAGKYQWVPMAAPAPLVS